jgi:hypothetical protein
MEIAQESTAGMLGMLRRATHHRHRVAIVHVHRRQIDPVRNEDVSLLRRHLDFPW